MRGSSFLSISIECSNREHENIELTDRPSFVIATFTQTAPTMSEDAKPTTPAQPAPEVKVSSADPPPALDTKSDEPMDLNSALEQMAKARAAQYAADRGPKKEVTYEEFQKMIDSTPLFMRETPKESGEDNYVLEALKSMMFDGDGDGEYAWRLGQASERQYEADRSSMS